MDNHLKEKIKRYKELSNANDRYAEELFNEMDSDLSLYYGINPEIVTDILHELVSNYNPKDIEALVDEIRLASCIGLTDEDFEKEYQDVDEIIKCLNDEYFITKYKKKDILHHNAFVGIKTLNHDVFVSFQRMNWLVMNSFEDTCRGFALIYGQGLLDLNFDYIIKNPENPSLEECICFQEELSRVKDKNFLNEVKYMPKRKYIEYLVKVELALAKLYLKEPNRFYEAYINMHRDVLFKVNKRKDYVKSVLKEKDYEKSTMLCLLIDMEERGYR